MQILRLTFMLLLLVFLAACGSGELKQDLGSTPEEILKNTPSSERYASAIEKSLRKELKSGRRMEEIFLGYKFGMSPEEVEEHSQKLVRENKLKQKYDGYYYNFFFDDDTAEASLKFDYLAGTEELMILHVGVETFNDNELRFKKLLQKYIRKYILQKDKQNRPLYYKIRITRDNSPDDTGTYDAYMFVTGTTSILIDNCYYYNININYIDNNRVELDEQRENEVNSAESEKIIKDKNLEGI